MEWIKREVERLEKLLSETNPLSADYKKYLDLVEKLLWLECKQCNVFEPEDESAVVKQPIIEPTPVAEPVQPVVVAEPIKQEPVKSEPVSNQDNYSKEYVRDLLSQAKDKGVLIRPLIEKYTPEGKDVKFPNIPVSSYKDLVEEIKLCLTDTPY